MPWLFLIPLDMSILKQYIQRLENVEHNFESIAIKAVLDNEKYILDLLKNEQLGEGLDSFGRNILHPHGNAAGTYQPRTVEYWAKKYPPRTKKTVGGKFNMDWSGKFKDSMTVKTDSDGYTVDSLTKRAMEAIYGTKLTKLKKDLSDRIDKKIIQPALYKHIFIEMAKIY